MAVEKFRSGEEMNAAPVKAGRGNGFDRFVRHCARYLKLAPRTYPRGVVKFKSLEDAQKARSEVARKNARKLRDRTLK